MNIYDINKNVIEIDSNDLMSKLRKMFPKLNDDDIVKKIKKTIKKGPELDELVLKLQIDKTEFILLIYKMYPGMFNKRMYEAIEKFHCIKKHKTRKYVKKNKKAKNVRRKYTKKASRA